MGYQSRLNSSMCRSGVDNRRLMLRGVRSRGRDAEKAAVYLRLRLRERRTSQRCSRRESSLSQTTPIWLFSDVVEGAASRCDSLVCCVGAKG